MKESQLKDFGVGFKNAAKVNIGSIVAFAFRVLMYRFGCLEEFPPAGSHSAVPLRWCRLWPDQRVDYNKIEYASVYSYTCSDEYFKRLILLND